MTISRARPAGWRGGFRRVFAEQNINEIVIVIILQPRMIPWCTLWPIFNYWDLGHVVPVNPSRGTVVPSHQPLQPFQPPPKKKRLIKINYENYSDDNEIRTRRCFFCLQCQRPSNKTHMRGRRLQRPEGYIFWKLTNTDTRVLYGTYGIYRPICYGMNICSVMEQPYHMVQAGWIWMDITVRTFSQKWDTYTIW